MTTLIQFCIDGSQYGTAIATTYNLDGSVKDIYTAGSNVYISFDTSTMQQKILFTALLNQTYASVCKFDGWTTKKNISSAEYTGEVFGIESNASIFEYVPVQGEVLTFIRGNFKPIDNMLVDISVPYKQSNPAIAGVSSTSGSGRYVHKNVVPISAVIDSDYEFISWKIFETRRNSTSAEPAIVKTNKSFSYTVNATLNKSVVINCVVRKKSTDISDFVVDSTGIVGSTLQVALSSNIYKQGCKCKWLLNVPSTSGGGYTTYGNNDWLYDIWSAYEQPSTSQYPVIVNLPLPSRISEIFSMYSTNVESLDCRLTLTIDSSTSIGSVYSLSDNNLREFSLSMSNFYIPNINQVTVSYGNLFPVVLPSQNIDYLLISGWSTFSGGYKTSSIINTTESGRNYLKVNKVNVSYNDTVTQYYTNGSDYEWIDSPSQGAPYGEGAIGSSQYITLGQSPTSLNEHSITITATNTANKQATYVYSNSTNTQISSPIIYGWYEPIYTLLDIYRCNSSGQKSDDITLNNCVYVRFSLDCAQIVHGGTNYNIIKTYTQDNITYADPSYLRIKINGAFFGGGDKVVSEGNNIYHTIMGTDNDPLDFNSNYTLCIYYRDEVRKTYTSSGAVPQDSDYFLKAQQVSPSMPLSLYQDSDTNEAGVGLGVQISNPGYITLGADSIFDTDINLVASKTIPAPSGSGTSIEYAQISAYDLIKRGSSTSVCVPRTDISAGFYANNIRLMTKQEYTNLTDKDSHTLYIIYKR